MQQKSDGQLAKAIYLKNMSAMKQILNMGEVKFGDRNSSSYKFFKKVVMDEIYNSMTTLFEELEADGVLAKCSCGTSIRDGYKKCQNCNGAGHCNAARFDEVLSDMRSDGNR